MPTENVERKLAAILHADVKGYSRLMEEDEVGTLRTLTAYRTVTDSLIEQHRGRIVGTAGDSILAEFASAVEAVQCAADIQQALRPRNAALPPNRRMEFRIGINVGDVIVEGPQLYGDGVNIAARLEALAEGGGICLSGTVYDQVENKLSLGYEYLGAQTVKNIAKPVRVYRVQSETEAPVLELGKGEGIVPLPLLPDKPSIVVLPFINLSKDPEQAYFSDGITEDITTDLSKISSLFVISCHSAFTYKDKVAKVQDISREMGVQYVLEGSVRRAEGRVRITVQLIDGTTDYHLWAERYDRPLTDVFALQDEIRQKVVFALKVKLTPEERERFRRAPTNNLEAYDFYLRGQESVLHAQYEAKKEENEQARQMLEKALDLDPRYAGAYTALGRIYFLDWFYQWSSDCAQSLERAFELVQRAVALDESLSMPHRVLGQIYVWKKQHEQAIVEAERAIALDPNDADGYASLGSILVFAGRPEEAIGLTEKAIRLNPRCPSWYLFASGSAYRVARRYEEALTALKRLLTLEPNYTPAYVNLSACYAELGWLEEAQAKVVELRRLTPNFSLEVYKQFLPYKDPAEVERFLAALRRAGLK
ncbi:MAG: adenylate/guanylate cyclase domain-containing protein [Deltaproteobacteria bacterium]|nr:adenylate/guanylate cyclase domain-containing protein [Deltaproteobacteria bacterium]